MIDLAILESRGITTEALRQKLSGNPLTWSADGSQEEGKRHALWNRIRSRISEGMNRNFETFKVYHALDQAWDMPFKQVSNTLLGMFIEKDPNTEEVYKQFQEWGLTHMVTQEIDQRTGKPTGKKVFNLPIFYEVFVPLVKAYVTIRWAKIMNDRRLTPFFDYVPAKVTAATKIRCGVITDMIETMSNQFGYYDVMKQAVLKMLHYGWCFQFPKEEWYSEEQIKIADEMDVELGAKKLDSEDPASVGDEIRVVSKEGLRYHHPHPTRFYRDLNHGPYTYNHDSGCEFGGYWSIRRYRDLYYSNFWNRDQVSIGPNSLIQDHRTFFASVYSACTLTIPVLPKSPSNDGNTLLAQTGGGIGDLDREKQLAYLYYGIDHMDQGVLTTEHFEKLIPSENGLGDYDGPVWFRFVVAGDNSTFLYAAPLPYAPITYYGYDADESRTLNASLSLEVLPFQDQFSNVLSQIILTAKQNLANMTLVDEDVLTPESTGKILNIGEQLFRKLNIFGFSGKKLVRQQSRAMEAIQPHTFPKGNVAELTNVLKTILDVLERVLVMSSHEVAQAASHEQTREEVRNIAASTSTRLQFTSTPVSIATEAWKRQLYQAKMAYGDPVFTGHIPSEVPLSREALQSMGFSFLDRDEHVGRTDRHVRVKIQKAKAAIDLWMLASGRDDQDRPSDAAMAQAMGMLARDLMANPITAQAVGADQAIAMANQIAQLAGLPRDFVLRNMAPNATPQQQQEQAQAQLQQVVQAVLGQLQPALQEVQQNTQAIAQIEQILNMPVPHPANDTLQPVGAPGGPS